MLFLRKRSERLGREHEAELERMVRAVRIGVVIAGSPKAAAAWQRHLASRSSATTQTVDAYKATLSRLGGLTHRGKPLGLVN